MWSNVDTKKEQDLAGEAINNSFQSSTTDMNVIKYMYFLNS